MKQKLGVSMLVLVPLSLSTMSWGQDSVVLDTMVVTADSTEATKREVTSNIVVFTEQEIRNSTAKDVGEFLSKKGFQTYTTSGNGAGGSALYIRGIGNSSMSNELEGATLILLNGHRTGTSFLNLKDLGNVERIELIRGPAAVQYGTSAIGGVVNIITKRGEEGFTTSAELGIGSYGRFDQQVALSGGKGGFDFSGALTHSRIGDYETGFGEKWRHTSVDGRTGVDLDAGYTFLENHRVGAHLNYFKLDDGQVPFSGWPDSSLYPDSFGSSDETASNTTLSYAGATKDKTLSWAADYTFGKHESRRLNYTDRNLPWSTVHYPVSDGWSNGDTDLQQGQARVTYDRELVTLTAGFDYIRYDLDTSSDYGYGSSRTSAKSTDYAGYLLGKLRLFDEKVILSAGGRYDSYKNTDKIAGIRSSDTNFAPSLGVAWLPMDILKLRANYAEGFHMPTPRQMAGDSYNYFPNADLNPEKSQSFEVGADLAWKFVDAELTYFHTDYKDKIVSRSVRPYGEYPNTVFENLTGKAVYAGLEFGLGVDVGKAFDQEFSLRPYGNLTVMTQRKNEDHRPDFMVAQDPDTLPYVPKMTASYGLSFSHPGVDLSATLNASYIGKAYSKDWNYYSGSPTYGEYRKFGDFTVVDLSVQKGLLDIEGKGRLELRAEVNNIFDKDYAYTMDYPMPGRNFYVGLRYTY